MAIVDFIRSLLPTFGRNVITDDLDRVEDEISSAMKPSYKLAIETFSGKYRFENSSLAGNDKIFHRANGTSGNHIYAINEAIPDLLENISNIRELARKSIDDQIAASGLTYKKANIIRVAQLFGFVSRYAMRYLNYVYILESEALKVADTKLHDSLSRAEIEWLTVNFINFCQAFAVVSGKPKVVQDALLKVPDIEISEDSDEILKTTLGSAKIDPMMSGFIPVKLNPAYVIGMMVAEWQAARYKEIVEELELIRFRKLNLELSKEGKSDPKIEKQIRYYEKRISELSYKQAKMEEDYV